MGQYTVRLEFKPGDKNDKLRSTILAMDAKCFPGDDSPAPRFSDTHWWIVRHDHAPVGYAGMRYLPSSDDVGYLSRAGIIASHRGKGLQKRLIQSRISYAKTLQWSGCLTYTTDDNLASANSLISKGFRLYCPEYAWAGRYGILYFQIVFKKDRA